MSRINEDYFYELKYICDGKEVTSKFNADINIDELITNLIDFLRSCSWRDSSIKRYIKDPNTEPLNYIVVKK